MYQNVLPTRSQITRGDVTGGDDKMVRALVERMQKDLIADDQATGVGKEHAIFRMVARGELRRASVAHQIFVGASDDEKAEIGAILKSGITPSTWERSILEAAAN